MSDNSNPFITDSDEKDSMDKYHWDSEEMNTLQDAYLMLRDAEFSQEDIEPLGEMLNSTTIYSADETEMLFDEFVSDS